MAQSSRQIQTQAQQQVQTLSPQQILVVKLLELPAVELEDRVKAELLENPALEEGHEDSHGEEDDVRTAEESTISEEDGGNTDYDSLSDYLNEDDIPDSCRRTTAAARSGRKKYLSPTRPPSTRR